MKKLLRYLRWSNLTRRHFRIADEQDVAAAPAATRPPGLPRESGGQEPTTERTDSEQSSSSDDRENKCTPDPTVAVSPGANGSPANGHGGGKRSGPGAARPVHGGDTFSDRGAIPLSSDFVCTLYRLPDVIGGWSFERLRVFVGGVRSVWMCWGCAVWLRAQSSLRCTSCFA